VGTASLGVVLVVELVAGIPLSLASILVTGAVISGMGLVARRLSRPERPRGHVRTSADRLAIVTMLLAAAVVVYLEAMFRFARLHGLYAFDAWHFWVPKAKAIYFFGDLDERFFSILPHPSYPPLVPTLEAGAFHFMGSADVVTLHVQFWFLLAGFVAAVAGLLSTRVPPLLLWPFVLLVLGAPRIAGDYAVAPQADFVLDYFFALGALLMALWLLEREAWQLPAATVLLAGSALAKRDGYLLAACVIAAAMIASARERRLAWPRLGVSAVVVVAAWVAWQAWFRSRDLPAEGPGGGAFGIFDHTDRAWPSLRLTLSTLFDYSLWLLVIPLAIAAILLAFAAGAKRLPGYAAVLYGSSALGFVWTTWAFVENPITKDESVNPIIRLSGSLILASAALIPLLLASAWRGSDEAVREAG
jgi:hypothetical protein